MQVIKCDWLTAKASEQWYRSLPLKSERGRILDANGTSLAINYDTYDIYLRAKMVENPNETALLLASNLGLDYEEVLKKATNKNVGESTVKLQVDEVTAKKLIDMKLPGVVFTINSKRHYIYGDFATQVLGFTTIDNVGQGGLELYYDKYLRGVDGLDLQESDVHGVKIENSLNLYVPAISGLDLSLTLDVNIQISLERALNNLMLEQNPKSCTGIVMNPNTGEIVAMSTKPSYDLNCVPRDDLSKLLEMSRNVSVVDVYEPGSTFKVLTMASAIEEKVVSLNDRFYDPGYRIVDGEKIKCWRLTGHGSQSLSEGLANSCNSVFIDLALKLGKNKMYDRFRIYNLGSPLGVDFSGEAGGILMNKDNAKTVDLARMGFGQAVAVSPLQLVSAFSSVVNGGLLYEPYFVKNIKDKNGVVVYEKSPNVLNRTISEETSQIMRKMVEDVMIKYSGWEEFIPGHRVGGKTGTTEKITLDGKSGEYIASFVGVYPADKPDYVVLVLADEPHGTSYFGSVVATPYAKQVIEDIIKYKNYPAKDEALS